MHPGPQARIRIVQSSANRWVKALREALAHPPPAARGASGSDERAFVAVEGFHLLGEALASGLVPAAVFFRSGEESDALQALMRAGAPTLPDEAELLALPPALFASLVETEAPRPITALLPMPSHAPERVLTPLRGTPLILVLAAVQDPGNVGTLLRSAEAFGATGAILLAGTATPWSGKALRASAGSALRLPLVAMAHGGEAALLLRRHGIRSYASVPSGGLALEQAPLEHASALWVGNEGAGLGERELAVCDARITVHMPGRVESLNAAVAGSLLLYEAARRRAVSR